MPLDHVEPRPLAHDALSKISPGERTDAPLALEPTLLAKLGIEPKLSDPIPIEALTPGVPYLIVDSKNRILCGPTSGWNWAWFGSYADWSQNVLGAVFTSDPTSGATTVTLGGHASTYLRANGSSTNWEWAFWGDASWSGYTAVPLKAVSSGGGYNLQYMNGSTTMNLCAATTSVWDYAFVGGSSWTPLNVTFRKFYLDWAALSTLFRAAWPSATITANTFRANDAMYELLPSSVASTIWNESGLSGYKWSQEVFDCDDFATVYKAQASRHAYSVARARAYATGMICGSAGASAHAANVFIDLAGNVQVLEPQNGKIVTGSNWKNSAGVAWSPYFIAY